MLELFLNDGTSLYIPIQKVNSISRSESGTWVVEVGSESGGPKWHNITGFTILREGHRMNG